MKVRFTQAARKRCKRRAHARHVLATAIPVSIETSKGEPGWLYFGVDDRDTELEIVAVEGADGCLLVVHVMRSRSEGVDKKRTPPRITTDTPISPDVNLATEEVLLPNGRRLTQEVVDELVEAAHATPGRPLLTAPGTHSL
ncbi:hypothetical protein HMPREF1531_00902 [Propionibacterium sp. oral taxon 192 str. F0372]|uniref:hypothetical protein n=1 Tax=Propionibacterium sp. oral taxon 192 TaxID=671222 RepID=UPI00035476EC|nr:hypothetical protein [Propionibacterium sp. oral taxon 192]EPH06252.1 hypothetical protein HMPREF1531_00902 [Propionibacterium sp. oral taxon 192 str. F0372]